MLLAWASLQSIDKIRKNATAPQFISVIFRPVGDAVHHKPWVLNLMVPKHKEFVSLISENLVCMGVSNDTRRVESKIDMFLNTM